MTDTTETWTPVSEGFRATQETPETWFVATRRRLTSSWRSNPLRWLAAVVYLVALSAVLFPPVYLLAAFDQVYYLHNARLLLNGIAEGRVPADGLFANPLVNAYLALAYAPVHRLPDWLILADWIGRAGLVALYWGVLGLLALRLRATLEARWLILAGLAAPPVLALMANNTPDGLFATISGFALLSFLGFTKTGRLRYLALSSVLIGLSTHARFDGAVLFVLACVLLALFLWIPGLRTSNRPPFWAAALALTMPFLMVVPGYWAARDVSFGVAPLSGQALWLRWYSYTAFEQGEGVAYMSADSKDNRAWVDGTDRARELYGQPEENDWLWLNAVQRNPQAYLNRLWATLGRLVPVITVVYSGPMPVMVLVGAIALARRRAYWLLLPVLGWISGLLMYLMTFYREGYLVLAAPAVLTLAAFGFKASGQALTARVPLLRKPGDLWWAGFLVVVLVAHWPLRLPLVENTPERQVASYLSDRYPRHTKVATLAPLVPVMAKMSPVTLPVVSSVERVETSGELRAWLDSAGVSLLHTGCTLENVSPALFELIEDADFLEEVYSVRATASDRTHCVGFEALDPGPARFRLFAVRQK